MANYLVKLKDKKELAEGTMEFSFVKPKDFQYKAGQYIIITLKNPPETDVKGNSRVFSLTTAPYEANLGIATRMRETAFKRVLKRMRLGAEVSFDGPYGSFVLHNDVTKPAVFLAGGIGITPFLSMIRQATKKKLSYQIFLFYTNRRPEDAPFLAELQELEKENPNYRFIGTMTGMEKSNSSWTGERGYIDKTMLKKYVQEITTPFYYLAGPPTMVTTMQAMLTKTGVNEDNIRTEQFSGY